MSQPLTPKGPNTPRPTPPTPQSPSTPKPQNPPKPTTGRPSEFGDKRGGPGTNNTGAKK